MRKITHIILLLVIASTLINNDYFCNPSLAAYFFYVLSASILLTLTGIIFIKNKAEMLLINYTPFLLFFLLTLYYLLEAVFSTKGITINHISFLTNALLLLSFAILFKNELISPNHIFNIITIAATIESIICVLQFGDFLHSQNTLLNVTGTWINPNVTAMFLAMSFPAILSKNISTEPQFIKWVKKIAFIIICMALVLLKCRTAIIGSIVALSIIFNYRYNFLQQFKTKYTPAKRLLLVAISLLLIIPIAFFAYKAKQNSADGRKLVWKVSTNLFAQNPIFGIGLGNFEHDYNLQQAKYFADDDATAQEISNASFVSMAYNEFLQNAVEGGAIALILFTIFIVSLLRSSKKQNHQSPPSAELAVSGVAAFAVMSIFNFSIQAIPAMCLFIIYAAIISANSNTKLFASLQSRRNTISSTLIISGLIIFFSQISLAKSFVKTKEAISLSREGYNEDAIELLKPLSKKMHSAETYWMCLGNAFNNQNNYKEALAMYKKASSITSEPILYMNMGRCYYKLHEFDSAINAYNIAKNIAPNRLRPSYALMKIYEEKNDTLNIIKTATEIVSITPKVVSKETESYKQEAAKLLNRIN